MHARCEFDASTKSDKTVILHTGNEEDASVVKFTCSANGDF